MTLSPSTAACERQVSSSFDPINLNSHTRSSSPVKLLVHAETHPKLVCNVTLQLPLLRDAVGRVLGKTLGDSVGIVVGGKPGDKEGGVGESVDGVTKVTGDAVGTIVDNIKGDVVGEIVGTGDRESQQVSPHVLATLGNVHKPRLRRAAQAVLLRMSGTCGRFESSHTGG